jgi:16S rRNA processing protein RimM
MSNWIRAGKAKEAHGLKGDLYILLFAKEAPWIRELRSFALARADEGPFEVHEVEKSKIFKDGLIVKAKNLSDRTAAESKEGLLFYLPKELFSSKKGESIFLREISGFEVRSGSETLGPIVDFSSNGPQDLLVVDRDGTRVEIPFVEAFLKEIDFEKRIVWMELPEGLWE